MTENVLKNPLVYRQVIFYEFRQKTSISDAFKKLSDFLGDDFMIYSEFEFWFQRFSSGKFDLDYDRSSEPISLDSSAKVVEKVEEKLEQRKILEPLTITDLPIHIFEMITDKLGKNCRFTLRHVCKSFRALMDTWDPGFKTIAVRPQPNQISFYFDNRLYRYTNRPWDKGYLEKAIDDLVSILKHPNLKLTSFDLREDVKFYIPPRDTLKPFLKKLVEKMESSGAKVACENLDLECRLIEELRLLHIFKPGSLKRVRAGRDAREVHNTPEEISKVLEEIGGLEQLKQAEQISFDRTITQHDTLMSIPRFVKCPGLDILFNAQLPVDKATDYIKLLLQSSTLKLCHLKMVRTPMIAIKNALGAKNVPNRPNLMIYHIPGSNEIFEIEADPRLAWRTVRIERKQRS